MATYFGPSDSPLFGVLHLPKEKQIRGGVIICSSLGKEGMDSVRFERILANDLADRGFGVLRFDYLGTGDSAFAQDRDDAVGNWRRSIEYAVEYLIEVGARSITAVALRAGGLILGDVLGTLSAIDRVVYVDPIGTGRRYLREQTALFTLVVGSDSAPAGTVSTIGARLSGPAAAELRALSLAAAPSRVDHLLVLRTGPMDTQTSTLAECDTVRSVTVDGLAEFAEIAQTVRPMPLAAVDAVVDWIDASKSTSDTPATPKYVASAKMPAEGCGEGDVVVECIESIGPTGLFAIRTRPEHMAAGEGKVVLFCGTANDPHFGPGREWVELSRRIAQSGAQALRWDRSGTGFFGPVSRDQWRPIYSRQGIAEAIAAAKHAATDTRNLQIAGICSGSWYAAQAARATGSASAVMINPLVWDWRLRGTQLWQWHTKKTLLARTSSEAAGDSKFETWRNRIVEAAIPRRNALKVVAHRYTPRWALRVMGRLGLAQLPEVILAALARNGTMVTLLLSPEDAELFGRRGGFSRLKRLERSSAAPRLVNPLFGDHTAYHWAMLEGIRETVLSHSLRPAQTHVLTS